MDRGLPFDPLLLIPLFVVIGFVGLWLAITSLLGLLSGWYGLQAAFPDRDEEPIERLRFQSGAMGRSLFAVNFGSCLNLDVCPGGLRVAVVRLLGPFQRPFLVPWALIKVSRRRVFLGELFELDFGMPSAGTLSLRRQTAERLAATGFLQLPV